jgi:hypothetical protein
MRRDAVGIAEANVDSASVRRLLIDREVVRDDAPDLPRDGTYTLDLLGR